MQRRGAVRLFREISKGTSGASINCVSLTPINRFKKDFELRISMTLNNKNLKDVELIVEKHGMKIKEDNGFIVIYEAKPVGIMA